MASNTLALILPAVTAIFAAGFLVLSRFNLPAAFAWGLGLGSCALAFAGSAILPPGPAAALVSDLFFAAGFFYQAEAFLIHFSLPLYRRERLAFSAIYLVANLYVVLGLGNLQLELLLNDIATSCLLGFALVRVMHRAVSLPDRGLLLAGSLIVVDTLIRTLVFVLLSDSVLRLEDFAASSYAAAMHITISIFGAIYVMSIAAALAGRAVRRLQDAAERDPLTGLLNRRGFDRVTAAAPGNGRLAGAVLICDIDHFKAVNDGFGHAAGDGVIRALAQELGETFGPASVIARIGGEEFVIFAPRRTLAEAGVAAQSVRIRFAARDWREMSIDSQISVSFGVAVVGPGEAGLGAALLRADACLYDAKKAGRNQVVLEGGCFELKPVPQPDPASNVVPLRRTAR